MTTQATVTLTRYPAVLAAAALGAAGVVPSAAVAEVEEIHAYGLEIDAREPATEYRARVGDYPLAPPKASGPRLAWFDGRYFEGVSGRAEIIVESRAGDSDDPWSSRVRLPVYVTASKLSRLRYGTMVAELRGLAAGLIFDLYSKSLAAVAFGRGGVAAHSNLVELQRLSKLWSGVAGRLREIAAAPATRLTSAREARWTDGRDRLDAHAVARLAAAGTDPRRPGAARPFRAEIRTVRETTHTAEHRELRGLLEIVGQRLADCDRSIGDHGRGLEEDRAYRDGGSWAGGEPSLYESHDAPRLDQLAHTRGHVAEMRRQVWRAAAAAPLRGLEPTAPTFASPVFEHVEPYRAIRDDFRHYLRSSLVILEDGADERLKATDRLYEQWVFFQTAAALRAAGLRCRSGSRVFSRANRLRFTLDLDRGARLAFQAADGRAVTLRYEPWVLSRAEAEARGESVYRGKTGAAWSPDVLLEFFSGGGNPVVEYAVVFDAKYTARVREAGPQDTDKYLEIRRTHTRDQIVKQVWRVCPDPNLGIWLRDDEIEWAPEGPNIDIDQVILGEIGLAPAENKNVAVRIDEGWIPEPSELLTEFIRTLLRYLKIPVA